MLLDAAATGSRCLLCLTAPATVPSPDAEEQRDAVHFVALWARRAERQCWMRTAIALAPPVACYFRNISGEWIPQSAAIPIANICEGLPRGL
jgi:hypothetical protein